MADPKTHYETHLADQYTWMSGGLKKKLDENRAFLKFHLMTPKLTQKALDLGCGPGFQTIPLAEEGFTVTAVDQSEKLLQELEKNKGDFKITAVNADFLKYIEDCPTDFELCVCMGDTLTHLPDFNSVIQFFKNLYRLLVKDGQVIFTFRDLSEPLIELDRFIQVKADENMILTCFLESERGEYVRVHDLIYLKGPEGWELRKSFYRKLKMAKSWVTAKLKENGLNVVYQTESRGFVTLIAKKNN